MGALRWIFLAACLGCVAVVAWNGRWEGRLSWGNQTAIVDLGRAPVWAPPPDPRYARFQQDFKGSEGFPAESTPGTNIQRLLKLDWMAADLLLYLWPVTLVAGFLYRAARGRSRDLILNVGLSAGIGLTAGAVACIGLWLLLGGWGPPAPEFFGGLGLVVGVIVGLVLFNRGHADEDASLNHGGITA